MGGGSWRGVSCGGFGRDLQVKVTVVIDEVDGFRVKSPGVGYVGVGKGGVGKVGGVDACYVDISEEVGSCLEYEGVCFSSKGYFIEPLLLGDFAAAEAGVLEYDFVTMGLTENVGCK